MSAHTIFRMMLLVVCCNPPVYLSRPSHLVPAANLGTGMPRYAAIDIGSNSVRMMAAEVTPQETRILAEDRQVTRLGESVFQAGKVSAEALNSLCATLARMAAAYQNFDVLGVRAVATSAVRDAGNQEEFIERVSAALGTPVEIISGQEE